ncbi:MAG TPA: hypothetical protein VFN61_05920 [Acidimicrobiales bacterium]|nr:hypothetical protein [Acidimicrobiales bacterium]
MAPPPSGPVKVIAGALQEPVVSVQPGGIYVSTGQALERFSLSGTYRSETTLVKSVANWPHPVITDGQLWVTTGAGLSLLTL